VRVAGRSGFFSSLRWLYINKAVVLEGSRYGGWRHLSTAWCGKVTAPSAGRRRCEHKITRHQAPTGARTLAKIGSHTILRARVRCRLCSDTLPRQRKEGEKGCRGWRRVSAWDWPARRRRRNSAAHPPLIGFGGSDSGYPSIGSLGHC
jgi:hypothetical protein